VDQNSKLLHFVHIFAKYQPIFTIFSPVNFVKKFATQRCAHHNTTSYLLCC